MENKKSSAYLKDKSTSQAFPFSYYREVNIFSEIFGKTSTLYEDKTLR